MKLNEKQTDGVLSTIGIPFMMLFFVAIAALFLILLALHSFTFMYAVAVTPAFMTLEKVSPNHYQRAELPEIWQKCFIGITDDWYFMVKRIADF